VLYSRPCACRSIVRPASDSGYERRWVIVNLPDNILTTNGEPPSMVVIYA